MLSGLTVLTAAQDEKRREEEEANPLASGVSQPNFPYHLSLEIGLQPVMDEPRRVQIHCGGVLIAPK